MAKSLTGKHSIQGVLTFYKKLVYIKLLGCICFANGTRRDTYIKHLLAFWCCIKCSALITGMCLSCNYSRLEIWKREVSVESNFRRKILTHCSISSVCPLSSFKHCLIFLTTLNEVKHNILSASSSQETDWEVFYFIIIELFLKFPYHDHMWLKWSAQVIVL